MQALTAAQMYTEFLINYDKVANAGAPGYEGNEIALFLNIAQERIIKTRINPKGNRYQESFEQTEKRRKDFSELIRDAVDSSGNLTTAVSANQNGTFPNGIFFDLPLDFLWAISEQCLTDINCGTTAVPDYKRIKIKPVTHDQFNANEENPFKRPYHGQAWRMDFSRATVGPTEKKRHELITDGTFAINKYYLRYIKRPLDIVIDDADATNNVDCELGAELHKEIVAKAVEIALETVGDPRFQTTKVENLEIE